VLRIGVSALRVRHSPFTVRGKKPIVLLLVLDLDWLASTHCAYRRSPFAGQLSV